ncbi:MAG: class I SAM-dependent methyltransferase [Deltaproteobacteria bacterium]|jgi:SAM-dependent methyltransferase|nr:class I SAM-dependent methyltransferase [Deltaproteobacteria bacterium]
MKPEETSDFASFDYFTIQGIPEQVLRVELLEGRLSELSKAEDPRILEIGIGNGDVTQMLTRRFNQVTCIDSDETACEKVKGRLREMGLSQPEFITSNIEDADLPSECYDHVVLLNLLEHLKNPVDVLKQLKGCLSSGGCIHITVPLANSLHRWLGVSMGMISSPEDLAESDVRFGHYRVYTHRMLEEQIESAGLSVSFKQGFYLKSLPTAMLTPLPMELHKGLFKLGERFPELAAYAYAEARAAG